MSKTALIDQIDKDFTSRAAAERAIDAVFNGVASVVRSGGAVSIKGFGTFKPKARAERMARNPQTGDPIKVAAKTVMVLDSKVQL